MRIMIKTTRSVPSKVVLKILLMLFLTDQDIFKYQQLISMDFAMIIALQDLKMILPQRVVYEKFQFQPTVSNLLVMLINP